MILNHLFRIRWPYQRPKISLNCVDHVNIKYWGWIISLIDVVNDSVIQYNTSKIPNHDIIYDYTSIFSKTCCIDNAINTKLRFKRTLKWLNLWNKIKHEFYPTHIEKDYVDRLIKNVQPCLSLFLCFHYYAQSSTPSPTKLFNIGEQSSNSSIKQRVIQNFKSKPKVSQMLSPPLIIYWPKHQPSILGIGPYYLQLNPPYYYVLKQRGWIIAKRSSHNIWKT